MTKITRETIIDKLQKLDEFLNNLDILEKEIENEEKFTGDFHLYGSVERYLQLACQGLLDIVDLIIIEEGFEKPEDRRETISLLFNHGVISENLAKKLQGISGFRNLLVHEYGEIDRRKVFQYLKENLSDFPLFKKEILQWLKGAEI